MSKDLQPAFAPVLLGKIGLSPHDDNFQANYPVTYQLMMPVYEGKRLCREPGVISIRVDGSLYRITVVCPTEGCQTTLETPTIMDVLGQVERHCSLPASSWTPTFDAKKKSRRFLDRLDNIE